MVTQARCCGVNFIFNKEPSDLVISSQISVFDSTSGPVSTVQLWKAREVLAVTRAADFICLAHSDRGS